MRSWREINGFGQQALLINMWHFKRSIFKSIFSAQLSIYVSQWARIFKKVQAKKTREIK